MTALTIQVAANDEDGYIFHGDDQTGFMGDTETFSNNSKVRIGHDNSDASTVGIYYGWLHLKNFTIAQGSTINSAKLYLYWHASAGFDGGGGGGGDPSEGMVVKAEDIDSGSKPANYNAVTAWTSSTGLTSASATVSSFIDASPNDETMEPNEEFSAGWYPSAGLEMKTVLKELVDRSGWSSGSNVNLLLTPSSYDGSSDWTIDWKDHESKTGSNYQAKLVIDYTAPGAAATANPAFLLFLDM